MAAKPRTSTSMLSALAGHADEGRFDVKAAEVAYVAGVTKETAQRFGRESPKTIEIIGSRWCATYSRGRFKIRERGGYREPEPLVAPDWFEPPTGLAEEEDHSGWDVGQSKGLICRFIHECIAGHIALAPWQRPAVWTEDQQVALLDSLMRGISIGALTMWHRPLSESVADARPLPGCAQPTHHYHSAKLIVDGQQRATTLVLAALGRLDHWRWNGHEWTRGKGFLTPRFAVLGNLDLPYKERMNFGFLLDDRLDGEVLTRAFEQRDKISGGCLDFIVLGGTADDMVEVYRLLATHGSPHSPMDLAIMEGWLERRRRAEGLAE